MQKLDKFNWFMSDYNHNNQHHNKLDNKWIHLAKSRANKKFLTTKASDKHQNVKKIKTVGSTNFLRTTGSLSI